MCGGGDNVGMFKWTWVELRGEREGGRGKEGEGRREREGGRRLGGGGRGERGKEGKRRGRR